MSTILNRGIKLFNLYNCLGIRTWAQKMEVHGANRYTTDGSKGNHSELLLTYRLVKNSQRPTRPQLDRRVILAKALILKPQYICYYFNIHYYKLWNQFV